MNDKLSIVYNFGMTEDDLFMQEKRAPYRTAGGTEK
jgi:hypothetical protein